MIVSDSGSKETKALLCKCVNPSLMLLSTYKKVKKSSTPQSCPLPSHIHCVIDSHTHIYYGSVCT